MNLRPVGHVVIDRLRKWVRLLKHHANLRPKLHRVDALVIDVVAIEPDIAFDPRGRDHVVHAVQATKEGRLPTTRRPDERRYRLVLDVDVYILDRVGRAIEDVDASRAELDLRVDLSLWLAACIRHGHSLSSCRS